MILDQVVVVIIYHFFININNLSLDHNLIKPFPLKKNMNSEYMGVVLGHLLHNQIPLNHRPNNTLRALINLPYS